MSRKREWRMVATYSNVTPFPARLVVIAEGYAMVRRPRAIPFVITAKDWEVAPILTPEQVKAL